MHMPNHVIKGLDNWGKLSQKEEYGKKLKSFNHKNEFHDQDKKKGIGKRLGII